MYEVEVEICSEIRTEPINAMWAPCWIVELVLDEGTARLWNFDNGSSRLYLLKAPNIDKAYCINPLKACKQYESVLFFSNLPDVGKITDLCEGFKDSPACPSDISSIKVEMSMDNLWNDTGRGKPKHSLKNLG